MSVEVVQDSDETGGSNWDVWCGRLVADSC